MSRRLCCVLLGLTAVTAALLLYVVVSATLRSAISPTSKPDLIPLGILFWTVLCLVASSVPVLLPGGSSLDLSLAPIVASMTLGGPVAAVWVSALGANQIREIRGEVPWYGLWANKVAIVLPTLIASLVLEAFPDRDQPTNSFVATLVAACSYFVGDVLVTATIVSIRDGGSLLHRVRTFGDPYLSMLTLAPLAWLMAQMYISAGWWAVLLFAVPLYTTRIAYSRFVEVREMFTETVKSLAEAVDKRDKFTSGHSRKVQEIAVDIGRAMKCSDDELEALEWGGLLHDIGKIGIPDAVLLKTERLTRDERTTMNNHPRLGAEIIAPVKRLAPEVPIILHHHEWFNGSGYPDRLAGDAIPKLARILHVADAFEAMTAARPYRMTPLSASQALAELRKFGGIQFDPAVVDAFVKTKWASGLPDPGKPGVRQVPLIGQASTTAAPAGGMAMTPSAEATPAGLSVPDRKGSLGAEPA